MYNFLDHKKVGLEILSLEERKRIFKNFYFDSEKSYHPKTTYDLYNPLSFDYFERLRNEFPNSICLDSPELNEQAIDIDNRYSEKTMKLILELSLCQPTDAEHFMFGFAMEKYGDIDEGFSDPDFEEKYEKAYEEHIEECFNNKLNPSLFIQRWKLEQEAYIVSCKKREGYLLDQIINSDIDVAVVGLAHVMNWKKQGLNFDYYMEDTFNNT